MEYCNILIIGAGPTGLGAATRLHQLGETDWIVADSGETAGGLASTDVTREGFLFDIGGHVIFSHYRYFDELLDSAVGEGPEFWNTIERVSFIWCRERWVPYPFQNNLFCLPLEDKIACINGLLAPKPLKQPETFDEWIIASMGEGIADLFMRPYNFKVWAYPTTEMQCGWLGERVATVNVSKVIENVLRDKPSVGWGPNAVFKFPKKGGTGKIWEKVAERLPQGHFRFSEKMKFVDFENKIAIFENMKIKYEKLILTTPLDMTLRMAGKPEVADLLDFSSTHVVGLGLRGEHSLGDKCWIYFPEDTTPFYRCTVFSNYSQNNCPPPEQILPTIRLAGLKDERNFDAGKAGPYWSLMFEISASEKFKEVDETKIVEETINGAVKVGLIREGSEIVSIHHRFIHRGYPTPGLTRDQALMEAEPFLRSQDVWSRGRFGSWKYEVSNQDHSLMLGVEAVDNILLGRIEMTLKQPDFTNKSKNESLGFLRE